MGNRSGDEINSCLSIVIPTYNRAEFLNRCLELLVPAVRLHGIAIYISDNASDDATSSIVESNIESYPFIFYRRNRENLGPDKNFELALQMPATDYIWLLGDTYQIKADSIDFLLRLILDENSTPDLVVVNVDGRVAGVEGRDYVDKNKLLNDLGWHMTCMSSLIYSKKLLSDANFERYRQTSFIQTGIVFEYIENREFLVKWVSDHSVLPIAIDGVRKISWQNKTFEIWVEKWSNFVFSLPPSYEIKAKLGCIKAHGLRSGVFSVKNLLSLRASGVLSFLTFGRFFYLSYWTMSWSVPAVFVISLVPRFIPKAIRYVFRKSAR